MTKQAHKCNVKLLSRNVVRLLGIAVLAAGLPILAQGPPDLPDSVTRVVSVEGITEYRLKNGLRVLLFPDASEPTVTVNVTYLVGSRHERYGETGIAHLLEHLLFKGTVKHPDIPKELTSHGGQANGSTWPDYTNYYVTMPASGENLQWALDLYSDMMSNARLTGDDLVSEMTVVRNEFEMNANRPAWHLFRHIYSTAYSEHNYGNDTIGSRSDIERVPIDRLRSFYRTHYRPDNALLIVAGGIDELVTMTLVQKFFSQIDRPASTLEPTYTMEPPQEGPRRVTVRRHGAAQLVATAYHVPAVSHTDAAAVDVVGRMLADEPAGRLHKALVQTGKATEVERLGVGSTEGQDTWKLKDPGLAVYRAEVHPGTAIEPVLNTLVSTVEGIVQELPTEEEVDRAKQAILNDIELTMNEPGRVALQLSKWSGLGDWRLLFVHRDRVANVTPDDVAGLARKYFRESNRTVGLFLPTDRAVRVEIPPAADVAAIVEGYEGRKEVSRGEAFDSSPEGIERELERTTLSSGMTLALLPKKSRGGRVVGVLRLRYGDVTNATGQDATAFLTSQMLLRGTRARTRQEIQDELDRLKARVTVIKYGVGLGPPSPETHHLRTELRFESLRESLPALFGLLAQILRNPSFPEDEFEQLKQQEIAQVTNMHSNPVPLAMSRFMNYLSPYPKGDPRRPELLKARVASIQAVTIDDVKRFHADYFGARDAEMVLVGNLDARAIEQQARKLFGNWEAKQPYARPVYPYKEINPVRRTIDTPDRPNAALFAGTVLDVGDEHPDYPALRLGMHMFGGGWLNSRLARRLRQKEGLSYGVGGGIVSRFQASASPLGAMAICAPENLLKAETAMREEFERAVRDGFSKAEVEEAKKAWLQEQAVMRADDVQLANILAANERDGRTMAWQAELEREVRALTPEDVNDAMRRHIKPQKLSFFLAGDLEKAGIEP